jgi:hypothetical protein
VPDEAAVAAVERQPSESRPADGPGIVAGRDKPAGRLGPNYLSLIKKSRVFREYEAYCRRQDQEAFANSLERAHFEPFRLRLEELRNRRNRRRGRAGRPSARV